MGSSSGGDFPLYGIFPRYFAAEHNAQAFPRMNAQQGREGGSDTRAHHSAHAYWGLPIALRRARCCVFWSARVVFFTDAGPHALRCLVYDLYGCVGTFIYKNFKQTNKQTTLLLHVGPALILLDQ